MEWTEKIYKKYNLSIQLITAMTKEQLKTIIKTRINTLLTIKVSEEAKTRTKLRFCSDFKKKQYLSILGFNETRTILKLKLNMIELKCNYKGQKREETCNLCKMHSDTTEHLFQCEKIKESIETPRIEKILDDDEESYRQMSAFLKKALDIKGIDPTKRVAENIGDSWEGI